MFACGKATSVGKGERGERRKERRATVRETEKSEQVSYTTSGICCLTGYSGPVLPVCFANKSQSLDKLSR